MPAWEDVTLVQTINKLLVAADKPENIVFGFGFNYENEPDISFLENKHYILRDREDYSVSNPGIIQIRNAIRRLITDEEYYLSIDAHANFESGWDTTLINDIEELHQISDRYVISKQIMQPEEKRNYYTRWNLDPQGFLIGRPVEDFDHSMAKQKMVNDNYFLNYYTSGNFIFAKRNWAVEEVEFADYHGFPFEEPEMSIVTFCNGFDVVSPIGEHCPVSAGNDPKYEFPYDERWWKFVGTDRNDPSHWQKIWVFDDQEMIRETTQLILTGNNKYFSLDGLPRSIKEFYDTIVCDKGDYL